MGVVGTDSGATTRANTLDRYVIALVAVGVATGLNWLLWELIKPQVSPLFFAAVMVSAWHGGLRPGLLATGVAGFISIYLFSAPQFSLHMDVADALRVGVFLAVAVLISALSAARRRAEEELRAAHAGLERRVEERTRELAEVNAALRQEVEDRVRAQAELVEHQTRLRDLAAEVALAEQRERRRLAQHLHDQIGQILAASQIRVAKLSDAQDAEQRAALCGTLEALIEEAIGRTRSITVELSPPVLYELGFDAAVRWLAEQFQKQHGVEAAVQATGTAVALSEEASITLFHIIRELLVNVSKHARARHVRVGIEWTGERVAVSVDDDGAGFEPGEVSGRRRSDSFGIFSIRERLRHHGGTMDIDSAPGRGSRITVCLPLAGGGGPGRAVEETRDDGQTS